MMGHQAQGLRWRRVTPKEQDTVHGQEDAKQT
jgi:hypothetical protein